MKIENIGGLYIIRGHYDGVYITASGASVASLLDKLFSEIAIYRSLKAYENY